jgi:hypothetical protein
MEGTDMKSKISIGLISLGLIMVAVLTAFAFVTFEKNKSVQLDETDITLSELIVDGNKMKVKIESANSLGMVISDNTYTYNNGVLKFKIFGSKNLPLGEPLKTNEVKVLKIQAPGDIEKIYFVTVDEDGKEKETLKSFSRGSI